VSARPRAILFIAVVALGGVSLAAIVRPHAQTAAAPQTSAPQPAVAPPATGLSPRNASYTIAATLDPATHTITGKETLSWRNVTAAPATTLQFHLYYNAWRNTQSTWMRESALGRRGSAPRYADEDWGWTDVTSVRLADGTDLTSKVRFIAPDDGNADDRTVIEIPLDQPVAPQGTLDVQLAWTARVPRTFARTGVIGDYYFIAQWFPKIGVLEDTGWNCHQFHAGTEFFSDFGVYDVKLTVPRGWTVGATGVERDRRDEGNATTHHYYQEDVHDFAWTTSPHYVEHRAKFEHPTLPPVEMRLLLQPEHANQAPRHFDATRATLKYYGEWFGAYPYGHITIIDPAWQSGAGGMEYPTLFTAGSRWLVPRDVTQPEGVTIHEAGHQFWYGIVASNEFEHAWMDEGLNTFSTARVIRHTYQPNFYAKRYFGGFVPWVFHDLPLSRATDGNRLSGYRAAAKSDAQSTPSWQYFPGTGGAITYNKTALWLNTLERMLGWETLQRIMSTYFERWKFRHPKPEDFFAVANEVSGRDLTWFFDQVHRSSNVFDYGVDILRSEPAAGVGAFGDGGSRVMTSKAPAGGVYRTTAVVRRYGEGIFPVDVRIVFENGEEARWHWDGRDRWKKLEIEKPSRAKFVQVDPDRVLLLDTNYTNNSLSREPQAERAARKWSLAWLIWLQDHLLNYGMFI
jgi:peptidase M1-like protein